MIGRRQSREVIEIEIENYIKSMISETTAKGNTYEQKRFDAGTQRKSHLHTAIRYVNYPNHVARN